MVRMILQYTAQPIAGANMLEQGAGELNIDGAVRLARTLSTNVDFQTLVKGSLDGALGLDDACHDNSTIGGNTFPWAQLVTGSRTYITGQNLDYAVSKASTNASTPERGY